MYTEDMVRDASRFDDFFDGLLELEPNMGWQSYSRDMNLLNGMNENRGISGSFTFYNPDKTAAIQISINSILVKNDISFRGHIHYEKGGTQLFYKYIIEDSSTRYQKILYKCVDSILNRKDLDPYFIPILDKILYLL